MQQPNNHNSPSLRNTDIVLTDDCYGDQPSGCATHLIAFVDTDEGVTPPNTFSGQTFNCQPIPPFNFSVLYAGPNIDTVNRDHGILVLLYFDFEKRIDVNKISCSIPLVGYICSVQNDQFWMWRKNNYIQVGIARHQQTVPQEPIVLEMIPNITLLHPIDDTFSQTIPLNISFFDHNSVSQASFSEITFFPPNDTTITNVWNQATVNFYLKFNVINDNKRFLTLISPVYQYIYPNIYPVLGTPNNTTYISNWGLTVENYSYKSGLFYSNLNTLYPLSPPHVFNTTYVEKDASLSLLSLASMDDPAVGGSNVFLYVRYQTGFCSRTKVTYSLFYDQTVTYPVEYPFGITDGDMNKYTYSSGIYIPKYFVGDRSGSYQTISNGFPWSLGRLPQPINDTTAPKLLSFEMIPIKGGKVLMRAHAKDNLSGVYRIKAQEGMVMTSNDLVSGDVYDGYYEKIFNMFIGGPYPQLTIIDRCGNTFTSTLQFLDLVPNKIPLNPIFDTDDTQYKFTEFRFEFNDIDVTENSQMNTLYLNFPGSDPKNPPYVIFVKNQFLYLFNSLLSIKDINYGFWNETTSVFEIKFNVPARLSLDRFNYILVAGNRYYESSNLERVLGDVAGLRVKSQVYDTIGPFVSNLTKYSQDNNIGWLVEIEDSPNGFEYGIFNISSDLDHEVYSFTFKPSDLLFGDEFKGTYNISIPIDLKCRTQKFTFKSVYLVDKQGYVTDNLDTYLVDPLAKFRHIIDQYSITLNCNYIDIEPPILTIFTFPDVVNVGAGIKDRILNFTIQVSDNLGISKRHNPYVYLTGVSLDVVKTRSQLISMDSSDKIANYFCEVEVPFGFAIGETIMVSIYGLVDKNLNINGYSPLDLSQNSFLFSIKPEFTSIIPWINSASEFSDKSTTLELNGQGFGMNRTIIKAILNIIDSNESFNLTLTNDNIFYGTLVELKLPKTISSPFTIQLEVSPQLTNTFTIVPSITPIPTIKPSPSPSDTPSPTPPKLFCNNDNDCGGSDHGYCIPTQGCICKSGWEGPKCDSTIIVIKPNNTSPNKPDSGGDIETTLPSGETVTFSSLISLVSIRELNFYDQPIFEHRFDQWILTTEQNSTKYIYTTNVTKNGLNSEIDDKNIVISNHLLDQNFNTITNTDKTTDSHQSQAYIGITTQFFRNSLIVDPDYSYLLDSNDAKDKEGSTCKSKGLSKAKLAGIIIGSGCAAAVLVTITTYYFVKKRRVRIFEAKLSNKMKNINN
eukprot:gene2695-3344_t